MRKRIVWSDWPVIVTGKFILPQNHVINILLRRPLASVAGITSHGILFLAFATNATTRFLVLHWIHGREEIFTARVSHSNYPILVEGVRGPLSLFVKIKFINMRVICFSMGIRF
jgi:hypothetical protein